MRPPDGPGIADDVALGAVVDRCFMRRFGIIFATFRDAFGQDFMTGQIAGGRAVPFPAHQAFDGVTFFHIGAFIQPVIGLGANPVASADAANDVASTHEQRPVRPHWILGPRPRS